MSRNYDSFIQRIDRLKKTYTHLINQVDDLIESNKRKNAEITAYKIQEEARERVLKSLSESTEE